MPVNTVKALTERIEAKAAEVRTAGATIETASGDALVEARKAFDEGMTAIEDMRGDLARAKKLEDHQAEFGEDRSGHSEEELGQMTPGERRSDKVNPLLNPDAKGYRLGKVILARMNGEPLTGVEKEVADELSKRRMSGSEQRGVLIPMTLRFDAMGQARSRQMASMAGLSPSEYRELNAGTTGTGALPTILSGTLIELLRNQAVIMNAGATLLSGLEGTFNLPKVTGAPVFAWGGEGFAPNESSGSITGNVEFTQKTISARSKITRRFAKQSLHSLDAEQWQRQQLLTYLSLGIDWGALHGPGTSNNVEGIFENANVNVISMGANGGPLTYGKAVDMETAVADANAEMGTPCYITNAKVRGAAKQSLKFPASGSMSIYHDGEINGRAAKMSNQIKSDYTKGTGTGLSGMAYGDFSQLVIGTWSGADLVVDPLTSGAEGATNIYLHQDVDVQVLHDEAFAVSKDIDAQF